MSLEFYKPNKSNTGHALRVNVFVKKKTKEDAGIKAVFLNFIKQVGFSEGGKGTFFGGKECRLKLNAGEVAAILFHINNNSSYSTFHSNNQGKSTLKFEPYFKQAQTDKGWVSTGDQKGFVLKASKTVDNQTVNFGIALSFEESCLLAEYLKYCLNHIFNTMYAEQIDRAKDYKNRQNQSEPQESDAQLSEESSF